MSDSIVVQGDHSGIIMNPEDSSTVNLVDLRSAGTVEVGSNLIGVDPLFVDPTAIDYHLRIDSPAENAGDNSPTGGLGSLDFDGAPRPAFFYLVPIPQPGAPGIFTHSSEVSVPHSPSTNRYQAPIPSGPGT